MGYAFNGVCYQTTGAALEAFSNAVTVVTPQGINGFVTAPTIDALGVIDWTISNRPLTDNVSTARSGTFQLAPCTSETMEQWPVQSILFCVALFFSAFLGFRSGFRP